MLALLKPHNGNLRAYSQPWVVAAIRLATFTTIFGLTTEAGIAQPSSGTRSISSAPNVVLILLDDAGYANTSTFGGPALTPSLDRLAASGLKYNRFHVPSICSATRAALLSGRNDHRIGFGVTPAMGSNNPGYTGEWPKSAASMAEILRRNGYSTSAFGKWHNTPEHEISPIGPFDRWPTHLGFEYFYGFMGGAYSQWEPPLYENTAPIDPPMRPEQGYHFTTDIADQAIRWIRAHEALAPGKPYFLYFATGATHFPHHVPKEWIDRYRGQFDQGWDNLRNEIFARQKLSGVIPADTQLTSRPEELPAWDSLTPEQHRLLARQMEVEAAFLAHTDHEIGRLIQTVQSGPGSDNTIIFYLTGDNGGDIENGIEGRDLPGSREVRMIHADQLGSENVLNAFSSGWGWATNTPFRWGKLVASHLGGIRNPMVVSWPGHIKNIGGVRSQFSHATDVAATVYELGGITAPPSVDGVEQLTLDGISLVYSFENADTPSRRHLQIFEQLGNRSIYHDGWMASARHSVPWVSSSKRKQGFQEDTWELYDLDKDFSQSNDLAKQFPAKLKELKSLFETEAARNNIYPLCPAPTRHPSVFTQGRMEFSYPGNLLRMPSWAAPRFDRNHRIIADLVVPPSNAKGVIVSNGSRLGGFALYVEDGYLVYENNASGPNAANDLVRSGIRLPPGDVEITYEFERDENTSSQGKVRGKGRLFVDGKLTGESGPLTLPPSGLVEFLGTFNLGCARISPVSNRFRMPFQFNGTLKEVRVRFSP